MCFLVGLPSLCVTYKLKVDSVELAEHNMLTTPVYLATPLYCHFNHNTLFPYLRFAIKLYHISFWLPNLSLWNCTMWLFYQTDFTLLPTGRVTFFQRPQPTFTGRTHVHVGQAHSYSALLPQRAHYSPYRFPYSWGSSQYRKHHSDKLVCCGHWYGAIGKP